MKTANTIYNANIIRDKYNSGTSNLRQLSEEFNSNISRIRKIIQNDVLYNPWYVKSEREFDDSLASMLYSENVSLKKIAYICSTGKEYSCQGALNRINKFNEDQ